MEIKEIMGRIKYTNKQGEEKSLWIKAGKLYQKDDGSFSVKINSWINPMAFANEKGECWFGCFEQRKEEKAEKPAVEKSAQNQDEDTPF